MVSEVRVSAESESRGKEIWILHGKIKKSVALGGTYVCVQTGKAANQTQTRQEFRVNYFHTPFQCPILVFMGDSAKHDT